MRFSVFQVKKQRKTAQMLNFKSKNKEKQLKSGQLLNECKICKILVTILLYLLKGIQMLISSNYPTVFAKKLMRKVGMYTNISNLEYRLTISDYLDDELDEHKALAEFQQMAIGGSDFNMCLLAFHGTRISKRQTDALKLVFESTKPWLIGHIVGQLSEKINSNNDRDFVAACELLLENLLADNPNESNSGVRKLVIKLKN